MAGREFIPLCEKLSYDGKEALVLIVDVAKQDVSIFGSKVGQLFVKESEDLPAKFLTFCRNHYSKTTVPLQALEIDKKGGNSVRMPETRKRNSKGRKSLKESNSTFLSSKSGVTDNITLSVKRTTRGRKDSTESSKSDRGVDAQKQNKNLVLTGQQKKKDDEVLERPNLRDKGNSKTDNNSVKPELSLSCGVSTRKRSYQIDKTIAGNKSILNSEGVKTRRTSMRKSVDKVKHTPSVDCPRGFRITKCKSQDEVQERIEQEGTSEKIKMCNKTGSAEVKRALLLESSSEQSVETSKSTTETPKHCKGTHNHDLETAKSKDRTLEYPSGVSESTPEMCRLSVEMPKAKVSESQLKISAESSNSDIKNQGRESKQVLDSESNAPMSDNSMSELDNDNKAKNKNRLQEQIARLSQRISNDKVTQLQQIEPDADIIVMEVEREDEKSSCTLQVKYIDDQPVVVDIHSSVTVGSVGSGVNTSAQQNEAAKHHLKDQNQSATTISEVITKSGTGNEASVDTGTGKIDEKNNTILDKLEETNTSLQGKQVECLTEKEKEKSSDENNGQNTKSTVHNDSNKQDTKMSDNRKVEDSEELDENDAEDDSQDRGLSESSETQAGNESKGKVKRHVCPTCGKTFTRKSDAKRHEGVHSDVKQYTCPENECEKKFKTREGLKRHRVTYHKMPVESKEKVVLINKVTKRFECTKCVNTYGSLFALQRHMVRHTNNKAFDCPECQKSFYRKEDMQRHLNGHFEDVRYRCTVCKKGYKSKKGVLDHMAAAHECPRSLRLYACNKCREVFQNERDLTKHVTSSDCEKLSSIVVTSTKLEDKNDTKDSSEEVKKFSDTNKKRIFGCDRCHVKVDNYRLLCEHKLIAHDQKVSGRLKCNICDKSFKSKFTFKTHMTLHTNERKYSCDICGQRFRVRALLSNHQMIHSGDRPYRCHLCPKSFLRKGNLDAHKFVHSDTKRFMCDKCGKTFKHASILYTHKRVHAKPSHFCTLCDRGFKSASSIKSHFISFHMTPENIAEFPFMIYHCTFCNKPFGDRQDRDRHLRLHTGEKPYSCKICSKRFSDSSNRNAHERAHNPERPHKCNICSRQFLFMRDMKRHKVSHEKKMAFEKHKRESSTTPFEPEEAVPIPDNCVTVTTQCASPDSPESSDQENLDTFPASPRSRTMSEVSEETFTAASAIALMQEVTMTHFQQVGAPATVQHVYPEHAELVWPNL